MTDRIRAFRALEYNPDAVELARVVAPPYDVIDDATSRRLYQRDPHNVIRLVLGEESPTDSDADNRYTRARDLMAGWLASGVLMRKEHPALFIYRQTFANGDSRYTRKGLMCAVKLEEFSTGRILPHEITLSGPKQDRMKLLEATRCSLSPVFAIYADPEGTIAQVLDEVPTAGQVSEVTDDGGVVHTFEPVCDQAAIRALSAALEWVPLLIADGHHRYETALGYHRLHTTGNHDDAPHAYVMMTLVSMADSGLRILPTHRVVGGLVAFDADDFARRLAQVFEVIEAADETPDLSRLAEAVGRDPARPTFGVYLGRRKKCLVARLLDDEPARDRARTNGRSIAWNMQDTSVLHGLILEDMMGITVDGLSKDPRLSYMRDAAVVRRQVDNDVAQAGFILNPTPIEAVRAIAAAGERMPPKSTYFYPKLLTGLAFFPHDQW